MSDWQKEAEMYQAAFDKMKDRYEQAHNDRAKLSVENAELRELLKWLYGCVGFRTNLVARFLLDNPPELLRIEEIIKE